jgi:hypothetical protein
MMLPSITASWRSLEVNADKPEVQERIRQEILKGTIRVVPARGGGIRIMPIRDPSPASVERVLRRGDEPLESRSIAVEPGSVRPDDGYRVSSDHRRA